MKLALPCILLFCITVFAAIPGMAQRQCATDYMDSLMQARDTGFAKARKQFEEQVRDMPQAKLATNGDIVTIPVVVHVVHDNENGTIGGADNVNITEEQILSQLAVLNEDFRRKNEDTTNTPTYFRPVAADVRIEFCLATRDPDGNETDGITRHYSSGLPYDNSDAANREIKSFGYWPSDEYLNMWVTDLISPYIGYAQLPSSSSLPGLNEDQGEAETDGVVMSHQYFGDRTGTVTSSRYNRGRSCVHEVGHWLGLLHPWHGGGCNSNDYCDDTPTQSSSSSGCNTGETSCGSIDMTENYMDYTDDACMNLFTRNQRGRMHRAMDIAPRREALLTSKGCCGASNLFAPPYVYEFNDPAGQLTQWKAGSTTNQNEWQQSSSHYSGSHSLHLPLYDIPAEAETWLTSPFLDLSAADHPQMDFYLAYSNDASPTDALIVEYDRVCDENWQTLKRLEGEELRTSTAPANTFTPQQEDWRRVFLDLSDIAGEGSVRIRIRLESAETGAFYLDRFKVYKYAESPQATIYPNPNEGQFNVEVVHDNQQAPEFEVFDAYGRLLFKAEAVEITSKIYELDLLKKSLQKGVYFLRITSGDESVTRRFSILH